MRDTWHMYIKSYSEDLVVRVYLGDPSVDFWASMKRRLRAMSDFTLLRTDVVFLANIFVP